MTRERYAVYRFGSGYVVDTCAGGTYADSEDDALTWSTVGEAEDAAAAADLGELGRDYEIVPLQQEQPARRTRR